jgi:diaminopimelate epimerase
MPLVAVTKMHGTLNDFVLLDERAHPVDDIVAFARRVCDRRSGVGADGLIVISPSGHADARMRIINADGSEAEMCGNGMRCAVRYLCECGEGDRFNVETLAGIVHAQVLQRGETYRVRLNVGVPRFEKMHLPFRDAEFVSLGNPHVVIFVPAIDAMDVRVFGAKMPEVNVHLAAVTDRHRLDVVHHERGVGQTQACGTGAVASAAAAIKRGLCDSPVDVHVPGGLLYVEWDGAGEAFLTGPAVRVFDARV